MIQAAIIIGSTRPGRVGESVGRWVYDQAIKPHARHMLDQLVAWGDALKTLRE